MIWSVLEINELVCDSTHAVLSDHIGRVVNRIDSDHYTIGLYNGELKVFDRCDLGPCNLSILEWSSQPYIRPKNLRKDLLSWCYECKNGAVFEELKFIYKNIYGLHRAICPRCGAFGMILDHKPQN